MVEIKLYPKYKEFEHFLDLYPPYLSNQGLPEWYKTQTKNNIRLDNLVKTEEFVDVKNVNTPSKFCPAIQEHITGGIIIPSWSDIYIVKNNEEVYWEVPAGRLTGLEDFVWIEEHGYKQVDMMNLNVIPYHLGVFKLVCPYYFETNEGYGLEFSDVMYHIRHNVKFLSGKVETDKWHETNFPFEFYEDISKYEKKTLYIKAGDPLIMVRPYKIENEKINLSLEKYSPDIYRQQEKNQTLKSSVSHNWKRYKKIMTNKVQFITVSDYLFDAKELLPKPISEYVPEWYANIPIVDINTNFNYINKKRTAKTCPSFIDIYREGYVIFSPTDVLLKVNEDGSWEWKTPMNFEIESKMELVSVHEDEQLIDYLENTDIKKVFKINLPIKIITPKGYNSRQIHFPYSNTSEWETAYGVMSTDKVHDLNIQILIKNYGETLIKQGTPIAVYIPFKREKYKHEIHREEDRPDLRKKINKKYLLFNGTFKNTYLKEHKK